MSRRAALVATLAHIHPEHLVSGSVAAAVGLAATDEVDDDGEVVWARVEVSS